MGLFELLGIGGVSSQVHDSHVALYRIEEKLDLILEHLQIEYVPSGVIPLLEEGKFGEAVQTYRQVTGVGRREAEDAVEALAASLADDDS